MKNIQLKPLVVLLGITFFSVQTIGREPEDWNKVLVKCRISPLAIPGHVLAINGEKIKVEDEDLADDRQTINLVYSGLGTVSGRGNYNKWRMVRTDNICANWKTDTIWTDSWPRTSFCNDTAIPYANRDFYFIKNSTNESYIASSFVAIGPITSTRYNTVLEVGANRSLHSLFIPITEGLGNFTGRQFKITGCVNRYNNPSNPLSFQ